MTTGVWEGKTEGKGSRTRGTWKEDTVEEERGHGESGRRTRWKRKEDTVKVEEGHGERGSRTR